MGRFWETWGGLVMWLAGGLIGGAISVATIAFMAWHDVDKRLSLIEQTTRRIEQMVDPASLAKRLVPLGLRLQTSATNGQD